MKGNEIRVFFSFDFKDEEGKGKDLKNKRIS